MLEVLSEVEIIIFYNNSVKENFIDWNLADLLLPSRVRRYIKECLEEIENFSVNYLAIYSKNYDDLADAFETPANSLDELLESWSENNSKLPKIIGGLAVLRLEEQLKSVLKSWVARS